MLSIARTRRWLAPDAVIDAIEKVVSRVPDSTAISARDPARASIVLARRTAVRAAAVSGALALPPGALGMVTVLPDLVTIWRLQAQMVADIAGLHGRSVELTRAHMIYCLFRHAASQAVRDIAVRTGQRLVMRQLSQSVLKTVLSGISLSVAQRVAVSSATRWLPIVGASAVAGYAYYDTMQVASTAIKLFTAAPVSAD